MGSIKKIIFFPYHPDLKTLAEHRDALGDYKVIGLISYKEDEGLIQALNQSFGLEDVPYNHLLNYCDAVIILDNYRDCRTDKYYQVIQDTIACQKEVLITPLAQSQLDLKRYSGQYKLLELLPDGMESIEEEFRHRSKAGLYDIDVPMLGVIGQGKNCDKFKTQLLLKEVLEEDHEVVTVVTNALGVLFGCYTIPAFFYEDRPFQEKVVKFNYYIRKISRLGNPDIIVLGIPEGIAPFEQQEFHHFAEYPLVITSAVSIDTAILCTYFMSGKELENALREVSEFCRHKFNVPICAIALSRTAVEVPCGESEKIIFEHLDRLYLRKYYPDLRRINFPIISMIDRENTAMVIKRSLKWLQGNVCKT